MLTASNYNDRVVALRYVYVLALSIWFGGIITIGAIVVAGVGRGAAPVLSHSYVAGALVLTTLFGMALLGPAPVGVFRPVRRGGRPCSPSPSTRALQLRSLSINLLVPIAVGGLALLFWEARDGTRAA